MIKHQHSKKWIHGMVEKKHLGLEELSPRKKITLNRFFFVKIQDMCVQILVFL